MSRDQRVTRCRCGAWAYRGRACPTCAVLATRHDLDRPDLDVACPICGGPMRPDRALCPSCADQLPMWQRGPAA